MKEMTLMRVGGMMDGTFGVLLDGIYPFAVTVERPWNNNKIGESCIPDGDYICRRVNSPKFGLTFEITGVSGRLAILFHKGNLSDDSRGCVILGESFGLLEGKRAVLSSGDAFNEFMAILAGQETFALKVVTALPSYEKKVKI